MVSIDDKYNLITRNVAEILGDPLEIKKIIAKRPLKLYFGTAPTNPPHIGYFVPILKIADYLEAGCDVTILLADLHAVLDNMKSNFEQIVNRTKFYKIILVEMLLLLKADISKLKFINGTDFQLSREYTIDMYRANTFVTVNNAKHAGAEVVKQTEFPLMSGLLYPTLQCLDIEYLKCDVHSCGMDQRKINVYSKNLLPKLGYKEGFYFMTKMVTGLRMAKKDASQGIDEEQNVEIMSSNNEDSKKGKEQQIEEKMSSSNKNSKIDILDSPGIIKKKINSCYCLLGDIEDNCLITILEDVLFPILKRLGDNIFTINRPEKYGGKMVFENIIEVKKSFIEKTLHPIDLKLGISELISSILEPLRNKLNDEEFKQLFKEAYATDK